jgi:hypothetical protein
MADYGQIAEFAAETAIGLIVANAISNTQSQYYSLAQAYFNMYQTQREFYFNTFQNSGELPFSNEQFGIQFYAPDYVGLDNTGYFPPGVWWLFNQIAPTRISVSASTPSYYSSRYTPDFQTPATELQPSATYSQTYAVETAEIMDDWNSYFNRYEEHKRDVFNERRWANRMGSLSYGVKEAYAVERELGTSFAVYDKAQGELTSEYDTVLNGLATSFAYSRMQKSVRENLGVVPQYQQNSFLTSIYPNG